MSNNNFIITGIPRSGTTLLCSLMNHIENVVCMNEIPALYDVQNLTNSFYQIRTMLYANQLVPMNIDNSGEIITDTQNQTSKIGTKKIDIDIDKPLFIGSKINVPYLFQIDSIIRQGFKTISVIRNPVYAIASWNKHANINEQYVMPEDFEKWPRYSTFDFKSDDKYERQTELWNYLAKIIFDKCRPIVKYEKLIEEPYYTIGECYGILGTKIDRYYLGSKTFNRIKDFPELINLNDENRFKDIEFDVIRNAANKHCKEAMEFFGYDI